MTTGSSTARHSKARVRIREDGDQGARRSASWARSSRVPSDTNREVEKSAMEQLGFSWTGRKRKEPSRRCLNNDAAHEEIGRLKVELDWLQKKVGMLD